MPLTRPTRRKLVAAIAAFSAQAALGGWVSTNYAVLACREFPLGNGQWWPEMDFAYGFTVLRALGRSGHGDVLPVVALVVALVAIHMVHRWFAVFVVLAMACLVRCLWREQAAPARRFAWLLLALLMAQLLSGLSNGVLGWPLVAALAHSAVAAALVLTVVLLSARGRSDAAAT